MLVQRKKAEETQLAGEGEGQRKTLQSPPPEEAQGTLQLGGQEWGQEWEQEWEQQQQQQQQQQLWEREQQQQQLWEQQLWERHPWEGLLQRALPQPSLEAGVRAGPTWSARTRV